MLIKILGLKYIVWDKAASIHFKKPGISTLSAKFVISEEEIQTIKTALEHAHSVERIYLVELKDAAGVVRASIEKMSYIRKKDSSAGVHTGR